MAGIVHVRPGVPQDASVLARHALGVARETEGLEPDAEQVEASVRAALEDPSKARYFVAEHEGSPVASLFVTYEWSDWNHGWYWWLQGVWVEPAWRRRGVFRDLYQAVQEAARSQGDVRRIRLYVAHDNEPAHATYEAVGMTPADYRIYDASVAAGGSPART